MALEASRHDEAGSSGSMIQIKIKTMVLQTYTLEVDKQMPVPALKERIASVTGVLSENQRLICQGKVLRDDQLLSAYHVEDGHTLHLVVREPAATPFESLTADSAVDLPSSGSHGRMFQVAPRVYFETFNVPGQGDSGLPDFSQLISGFLGSTDIGNTGNGSQVGDRTGGEREGAANPGATADTTQIAAEQSVVRSSTDMSRLQNVFGIPAAISFGSVQAPVIPDALATLSQYLNHMRQEILNRGIVAENGDGVSSSQGNEGASGFSTESASLLPSPASLAALLSSTSQMLNQLNEECLLQLATQLENQVNMIDPEARRNSQSSAWRSGILLQNLGAFFLELGRTVSTLRLGLSPSEAVVNTGPAVFISPCGPNPLMVQPLPFQPGASFGTPLSGALPPGSGLINGSVPRRIEIQIRREPVGSQQSSGPRQSSSTVTSSATPSNWPTSGASGDPSSNSEAGVHNLPFRTTMAGDPDLSRSLPEPGSLAFLHPFLERFATSAYGNLRETTEAQMSGATGNRGSTNSQQNPGDTAGNERIPVTSSGQRESVARTLDINILSAGGIPSDQNSVGQIPPSILHLLRGVFPGGELHIENIRSEETTTEAAEQPPTSSRVAQEAGMRATEEGLFLSRMLQQIMPLISLNPDTEPNAAHLGGNTSSQRDDTSSLNPDLGNVDVMQAKDSEARNTDVMQAEDSEARNTNGDHSLAPPNPKRQKTE